MNRSADRWYCYEQSSNDFVNPEDQRILREQDVEFERAVEAALELNKKITAEKIAAETSQAQQLADELSKIARFRNQIRDRAAQIPPEPAIGVAIAISFPDFKRVTRKFGVNQLGDDIYAFAANSDQLFDGTSLPLNFALRLSPGSGRLERNRTLAEQGLTRRTLIHVVLNDDDE
jgi:hypothetical protein